jgi:hypothetical protein
VNEKVKNYRRKISNSQNFVPNMSARGETNVSAKTKKILPTITMGGFEEKPTIRNFDRPNLINENMNSFKSSFSKNISQQHERFMK